VSQRQSALDCSASSWVAGLPTPPNAATNDAV
jgi:hypothetical protein